MAADSGQVSLDLGGTPKPGAVRYMRYMRPAQPAGKVLYIGDQVRVTEVGAGGRCRVERAQDGAWGWYDMDMLTDLV